MRIEKKLLRQGTSRVIIIPSWWLKEREELGRKVEQMILDIEDDRIVITLPEARSDHSS